MDTEAVIEAADVVDGRPPGADRKEQIIRMVALFVMPFLMVTMMFATYMSTMHSPHPRDMPVAVVGSGATAQAIVDGLNAAPGDTTDATLVATRDDAVDLLHDQEAAAALILPSEGSTSATILTASAAGASQGATVQQLLAPVAVGNNWQTTTEDVAPLPDGDLAGIAVLFAGMGMMLAGYVPLSIMVMGVPHLLRLRRFLPVLAGWSAATSSIIWLILGPIVGAVEGHYLTFLGVGMLATGAVGMTQLLLSKLIGPLAVLPGMLLWVVFGMPASNLALSVHNMPGFFQFLHGVLPLPAAGESLRSVLYFNGNGLGIHLIVLAVWIVAALALCLLKERSASGKVIPGVPPIADPDAKAPALAGGPPRSKRFRYVAAAAFPLSILVVVVGAMGFSMHKPQPHDIPVVVVAAAPGQAQQTAAGLNTQLDGILDVTVADTADEATEQIRARDVVAAFVLPSAPDTPATLYSASAANASQQSTIRAIFQPIAASQGIPLTLTDVQPLSETDTGGSNSMYVGMSWIMAGFLFLAVLRGGAPHVRRLPQFLPLLGGWAIGMSVWLWFLFDVLIGAISGNALETIAYGALTIFSVSLATGVLTRTVGLAGIIPMMVVLMMAGVPASGGGMSVYLVPEVFRPLQDVLPLPAAVDIARSLRYFDGVGIGQNLLVIAIWGAAGLVGNLVIDQWLKRRERRLGADGPDAGSAPEVPLKLVPADAH
ncbi:ABC transporter permease [Micromonospora sp. NPDC005189]|uniref:ABC transporter permease n=1 Tax=unclassified Micromonospora TaxID=2617518 RepID=UPI0033B6D8E2